MTGAKLAPAELVRLAPRLKSYLRGPDPSWPDIIDAADYVRSELDISKPLWGEACILLGREAAAVAVAIVSTKPNGHFKTSAAGYFHGMLAKAKAHELNLDRTVWKLRTDVNLTDQMAPPIFAAGFRTQAYRRAGIGTAARREESAT